MTVISIEHNAKHRFTSKTSFFAMLRAFVGLSVGGAPSLRLGSSTATIAVRRFVPVVAVVVIGMFLCVSQAFADAPTFVHGELQQVVHSTRVSVESEFHAEGLATEWQAEYALPEADGKPPPPGNKWTVVNGGTTQACRCSVRVHIGASDLGETLPREPIELRHLEPATSYYVRFLAKNSAGEAVSQDGEPGETILLKTLPVGKPELPKREAREEAENGLPRFTIAEITDDTAVAKAKIETNGAETKYSFEYATSKDGPWTPFTTGATGAITSAEDYKRVEAHLEGLMPEKEYYVRLKASNEKGEINQTKYALGGGALLETFTTGTAKAEVTKPGVRNVRGDSAHLSGEVVPHGLETHWRLEYSMSVVGPWMPVPGAGGTISTAQAQAVGYSRGFTFGAQLSGLSASAVYDVRMFAENAEGGEYCYNSEQNNNEPICEPVLTETRGVGSFETSGAPSVTTFAVHALHGESLRLLGLVNPNSLPTSAEQSIAIVGAPTGGTFTLTFEGHETGPIAVDASADDVQGALVGLPGEPRVGVEGSDGGPYTVFFDGGDSGVSEPRIEADGSGLTPSGTVSVTTVQQGGEAYDTHYRFQYVSQESFGEHGWLEAGETAEGDPGAGDTPVYVGADLPALKTGETYDYRLLASNTAPGTSLVEGAEETLRVPVPPSMAGDGSCANEAFRTGLSAYLPDCRAYEMLTPVDKGGAQEVFKYGVSFGSAVLAGEDGDHVALEAPHTSWGDRPGAGQGPYFFAREAGGWRMTAGAPQPETGIGSVLPQVYNSDLTRFAFESIYEPSILSHSEDLEYKVGPAGGPYSTVAAVPRAEAGVGDGWVASSADFSKLVLQTQDHALLGEPTHTTSGPDLYEYTAQDGLVQLNVTTAGVTIGACGATIAHGRDEEGGGSHNDSGPHSLSADGSRVFFEAVPGKNCSEPKHLYMRVDGGEPDAETVDIGVYELLGANADGAKLLLEDDGTHEVVGYDTVRRAVKAPSSAELETPRELASLGINAGVGNPYEADPEGALERGRYVYFSSVPEHGEEQAKLGIAGDSAAAPGQVYRYDSVEHLIECISCASPFDPEPRLSSFLHSVDGQPEANGGLPVFRTVSANGDFAFFTSTAALVPQDVDGETEVETNIDVEHGSSGEYGDVGAATSPSSDVYEWRAGGVDGCARVEGCLALITDGRGGYKNLLLGTADEGRDVFIFTRSELLPQDDDSAGDIYDARIGGGFAPLAPRPVECEGDACSTPPSPPNDPTPSSLTFSGAGNLIPPSSSTPAVKAKKPKEKKKVKAKHAKRKPGKGKKAGAKRARKAGEKRRGR